jgi:hypothetical protein
LFRFSEISDVSIEPEQTKDQPKQFDMQHIFVFFQEIYGFSGFFRFFWFVSK